MTHVYWLAVYCCREIKWCSAVINVDISDDRETFGAGSITFQKIVVNNVSISTEAQNKFRLDEKVEN